MFTMAVTYKLDPRYTVVFSQQYDFEYGQNIRTDFTILRRYHRMYWSLTFSKDDSLDRSAVMLSFWPQGISEMAFGSKEYAGIDKSEDYQ